MAPIPSVAQQACDQHLQAHILECNENRVLPSEVEVAERLLSRADEAAAVYDEIYPRLSRDGIAWKVFLGCLLSTAAFWSPEKLAASRDDRDRLMGVNADIARHAAELADLLERRDELNNTTAFGSPTLYHVRDVVDRASQGNGYYQSRLEEPLHALSRRFDFKYWPSLAECVRVIGVDASAAEVTARDPMTEAGTKSTRPSKADFLRALLGAIDDYRGDWLGSLPHDFRLSDRSTATLVNVLLDLPADELVDADYVKTLRGRDKRAKGKASAARHR